MEESKGIMLKDVEPIEEVQEPIKTELDLELEKYQDQLLTSRPEEMSFIAYKIHIAAQNRASKKYLKGRMVYPGAIDVPLKNEEGKVEKIKKISSPPIVGAIKETKMWNETL